MKIVKLPNSALICALSVCCAAIVSFITASLSTPFPKNPQTRPATINLNLNATRPLWMADPVQMARFDRLYSQSWTPMPEISNLTSLSKSQDAEDQYAFSKFFYQRGGGTFLEMGALDGLLFSNTFAFDKLLGWRGIHIEASPSSYVALTKNRVGQINIHTAVCAKAQEVHYADDNVPAVRGIAEFMSEPFKKTWHPDLLNKKYEGLTKIPCLPLTAILRSIGVQHINFYVLDVEGGELEVLKSINFSMLTFDVIAIENDGTNPAKDQGVREHLERYGYNYHSHVVRNDWFVRAGFIPSSAPS